MMTVKTYIDKSPINGVGIYAAEPIAKGTEIWRFQEGLDIKIPLSRLQSFPDLAQNFLRKYGYHSFMTEGYCVLEFDHGRFMNHSDTPNTDFTREDFGYTLRDIAAGEELTCNYSEFCTDIEFVD